MEVLGGSYAVSHPLNKWSLNLPSFVRSRWPSGRASASEAVDLGLIPSRVKPITLKLVFTASLLDPQHLRDTVENKLASSPVVPLGKALSGIPLFCCGRQVAGNSLEASSLQRFDRLFVTGKYKCN